MQQDEGLNNQNQAANKVAFVILCGGKSSRMGENKTFLPFGQYSSLIHYQYEKFSLAFPLVYISSKTNDFAFLKNKSCVLLDKDKEVYSPLVALKSILEQVNCSKVFILTVDTPFVSQNSVEKLIQNSFDFEITIASTPQKVHNLCGVFSKNLLPKIDEMLKQDIHKIGYLIKQSQTHIINFEDETEFLNMNTKLEYEKALKLLK